MTVQTYAYVPAGIVEWLWPHDATAPMPDPQPSVADVFAPEVAAHMVACDATVQQGWTYDGKTFAVPAVVVPAVPVRTARGAILVHTLDKATKVTPRDLAYVAGLDAAREDMPSIIRIATVDGLTAKAWFDLALGVGG